MEQTLCMPKKGNQFVNAYLIEKIANKSNHGFEAGRVGFLFKKKKKKKILKISRT